ncbi:TPA: phage tail protein, partial [Escherichia coli]|nr:phage tail protein [Escherichia coli]
REYANQTAEPYRYVLQPLPDVWIPFNDSLDMITGYSPGYKKVKIGDNVVQVASDKQVNFSRASTATYINKSGELKTAEINEPRFECDGLLIEGQRTNFFPNSTDPSKWNKSTSLDVTETGTDSFGFNYGRFVVQDSIVGTSKAHTIIGLYSSTGGVDTSGDEKHVTISCRVKSEVDNIAVRILFEHYDGEVRTSIGAANLNLTTRIISKTGQTSRVTARSVKDDATGWIFFEATLKADTTENTVGGFVQYSPDTGQMVASGDYLDVTTPQIEAGTGASSFIVTGTAPVTRASDMVTVPIKNNLYNLPFTVLCEVHKNWYKTPNAAPRVFDTYRHQADAGIVMGFGSSGGYDGFPYCDIGGSNRRINENAGLEKMLIGMRVKSERSTCVVSNGKLSSETKT